MLTGYVATAPRFRTVRGGTPVVSMRVGMTTRRVDRDTGEWQDGNTSYVTVTCWRTLASNVASCIRKGEPVVVRGKFKTNSYEDREGRPRSEIEIDAETVGHDLSRGVAHFQRTRRLSGETAADRFNADLASGETIRSGAAAEPADEEDMPAGLGLAGLGGAGLGGAELGDGGGDGVADPIGDEAGMAGIPLDGAGAPDAGAPDAGAPDAGAPDAGAPDAGAPDAGAPDADAPDSELFYDHAIAALVDEGREPAGAGLPA